MVTIGSAARMMATTPATIKQWIANGRAIGLTQPRRAMRLPQWQFESPVWDALASLAKHLGTDDGWALLSFLETPAGGLNGRTPRQAIEQGDVGRTIEVALAQGH